MSAPAHSIAATLALPEWKVAAALRLFDEGATVPFVARYRKEKTGSLDETALRAILERRDLLAALAKRREAIRATLAEQGQLTPALEGRLAACVSRVELEELYAPFKKKRKTRADKARELGLAPLAKRIVSQPRQGDPSADARRYVPPPAVPDVDAALAGARDIIAEELAADPRHRVEVRLLAGGEEKQHVQRPATAGRSPIARLELRNQDDDREAIHEAHHHRVWYQSDEAAELKYPDQSLDNAREHQGCEHVLHAEVVDAEFGAGGIAHFDGLGNDHSDSTSSAGDHARTPAKGRRDQAKEYGGPKSDDRIDFSYK